MPLTVGGTALQSSGSPSKPQSPAPKPQPLPIATSKFNPHAYSGTGTPDPSAPFPRPAPPPPSHVFNPGPELWHEVLRALSDPYQSLHDAAAAFNTTLTALTAWMARPEIEAELDNFERQGARKARLAAVAELPKTVVALSSILDSYSYQERKVPVAPNTEAKEQRRRHGESSRKAAWLIYRIARFYAGPPAPPTARRVEVHHAKDGTVITTPSPAAPEPELKSLPPLETVADTLQAMISQFHSRAAANRVQARAETAPIGAALDDTALGDTAPGGSPHRPLRAARPSPTCSSGTGFPPVSTHSPATADAPGAASSDPEAPQQPAPDP